MNILWICTDQQRFDSLGCYGNPHIDTPNLDALAQGGVQFDRCYAQSPVCSPSRASFLTGRYPQVCGMYENGASISPHETLVTKLFAQQGYTCGLAGKLHIAACHPSVCPDMEGRIDDGYSVFHWSHHPERDWPLNDYHVWLDERGEAFRRSPYRDSPYIQEGMPEALHHTTYCTERTLSFLRSHRGRGQNWMFTLNYFDPHHAFDPPKRLMDKYYTRLAELPPPNYREEELENKPLYQQMDHRGAYGGGAGHPFTEMDDRDHRMHRAAYYAMVELIDTQVGRLIHCLKETGQYEDTLVVFTSDHGEMLGDHGIYLKGPYFYDCAVRVPLIVSWPGHTVEGLRSSALVELVDLPQTLLEAAGLEATSSMMGRSLWEICTGKQAAGIHKDLIFCEYWDAMPWHKDPPAKATMVFDGRHKLVVVHSTAQGELYDLEADPEESSNLWADPEHTATKLALALRMTDKLAEMRDPTYTRISEW